MMRTAAAVTFRHGAAPVELNGSAFDRGRAQAERCPGTERLVRDTVERRLAPVRAILARPWAAEFIARQWEFTAEHGPAALAEVEGIASGYGIPARDLFASLHTAMLLGFDESGATEGCSAWALPHPEFGALLGKNRDLAGAFHTTQRVFRHRDPAWNGRAILCVGSLGAPGVYSSGVNSDGLALADTQIRAAGQGVGLLRYFAMTRVLERCATVEEALDELRGMRHAGGGGLVLADARGRTAAVELGYRGPGIERSATGRVARTNHFVSPELRHRDVDGGGDRRANSEGRLRRLRGWLDGLGAAPGVADATGVMASHDDAETPALCRHGGDRGSTTISGSVFACRGRRLYFAESYPCSGAWEVYECRQEAAKAAGGLAKQHGGGA
ncbi:MAG TPA: C45 family peptidase [bacterium]|nr:C45 family peptidase [bacterium]